VGLGIGCDSPSLLPLGGGVGCDARDTVVEVRRILFACKTTGEDDDVFMDREEPHVPPVLFELS